MSKNLDLWRRRGMLVVGVCIALFGMGVTIPLFRNTLYMSGIALMTSLWWGPWIGKRYLELLEAGMVSSTLLTFASSVGCIVFLRIVPHMYLGVASLILLVISVAILFAISTILLFVRR